MRGNAASSNLLPFQDNKWMLVDCGYGCARNLSSMSVNFDDIQSIAITHFHNDHFCDLPTVIFSIFMTSDREGIDVFVPPEEIDFLQQALQTTFRHLFETIKMATGKDAEVRFRSLNEVPSTSLVNVLPHKVQHGNTPTYGLVFKYQEDVIGVSSDTIVCEGLDSIASSCDHLILDCAFSSSFPSNPLHATASELAEFLKGHELQSVLLNHLMPETMGKEDAMLQLISKNTDASVRFAEDMERYSFD